MTRREYGQELEWIPTTEVRAGDRIACLLSDAEAYPEVTGWSDRTIDLTRYELGTYIHRTFAVGLAPWWAGADMRTFDLAGETLIVKRGTYRTAARVLQPDRCAGCAS